MIKLTGAPVFLKLEALLKEAGVKGSPCYTQYDRFFLGVWVKEGDFNWFIPVGHFVGIYEGELISIEPDAISKPIESLPNMRGNVASKLCGEAKV